jgi:polysaccharide export outer membrane protein
VDNRTGCFLLPIKSMKRFFHCMAGLFVAVTLSACCPCVQAPPPHITKTPVKTTPPLVQQGPKAGDVLTVTVEGEADLSGDYTVGPDGNITMPLVGKVAVAGQPQAALAGVITDAYRAGYLVDPKVRAEVKSK